MNGRVVLMSHLHDVNLVYICQLTGLVLMGYLFVGCQLLGDVTATRLTCNPK